MGGSVITSFNAKSVQLDWTGLELSLAKRVFLKFTYNVYYLLEANVHGARNLP